MRVSEVFNLGKSQSELDFVDVDVGRDNFLFVDPFAISQRPDPWSQEAHQIIVAFFQRVVNLIRSNEHAAALEVMSHLREPNETRLGLSRGRPQGAGIGNMQAEDLLSSLARSSAVRTGSISSLEECELMVEGIGRDKISDLTTNIIRRKLAIYTNEQCDLHEIPTVHLPLPPYYDPQSHQWRSDYFPLPQADGRPLVLVPKLIARYTFSYNQQSFYQHFILNYLQTEHLNAGSSLVQTLRNGRRRVTKKAVAETYPCTKANIAAFARDHPEVLTEYRRHLAQLEQQNLALLPEEASERALALSLEQALVSVAVGAGAAGSYHSLMIGLCEFLFFPHLVTPAKEREIHQGRKRIDIVMSNSATDGAFETLHRVRRVSCPYIFIECKNYTNEIANPELDQLAGRFGVNRGTFGLLCCRRFQDRSLFAERCRDTYRDGRGLIVGLSDAEIIELLRHIATGNRRRIDRDVTHFIDEIALS
ncbi:MAG TPA: hypothetical protein VGI60_07995 [Chthoniobacterales bacterium]|jgi:hypothetical protein